MLYAAAGWPKQVMMESFGTVGCPLVATQAKFIVPCTFGEEVSIVSSFVDIRNSSFDIRHELSKEGITCVEGFETRVWTRRDLESGRLKSVPIPAEVAAHFRGYEPGA